VARRSHRSGQTDKRRASSNSILCDRFLKISAEAARDRVTRTFPQNAAVMTSDGTILA
jgi:hypothetical protein